MRRMQDFVYSQRRIALHWSVALLIFATFPLGLYMHDLALTPTKLRLFSYHKWLGVTILLLSLIRIWIRATDRAPVAPPAGPHWQQLAANAAHALLYALILVIPISGWLMSSAQGFQTVWFGVVPIPDIVPKNKDLASLLKLVHKDLNFFMLGVVVVHVLGALQHQFVMRDGVLSRMIPALRK
jgi:cytochrome b561